MPDAQPVRAARRRAPPSASSAAASSAACWRWPRRASASRRTSIARTAARPSTSPAAPPRPPSTTRPRSPTLPRAVDAVTYEFENVPIADRAAIWQAWCPCGPSAKALEVAQDRLTEKQFISGSRHPRRAVSRRSTRPAELASRARGTSAAPAILKTRRLGYDGKGQVERAARRRRRQPPGKPWAATPCVLEKRVAFACEISALVGARPGRRARLLRLPAQHARGRHPAPLGRAVRPARRATSRARATSPRRIAAALDYVGVLAVEMFYLGPDAPRGRAPDGQRDRAARAQLAATGPSRPAR